MEKENKYLEYKERVNRTYLKTVSAFANYHDGTIIFGIDDDLKVIGINNPVQECLNIENQINDNIKPLPDYYLKINNDNTISLFVKKGIETPYRYNEKCYKRNDTATIPVDIIGEKRLILEGLNLKFEELKANDQNLTFNILGDAIKNKLNLEDFNLDTLKSLNLYNKQGFNNAASLLSDKNSFPGLDIAVFGTSFNDFKKRLNLSNNSLIKQYDDAIRLFKDEYIVERIEGGYRNKVELIPFEAYREALANSLIHRDWDIDANTKIEMYQDKIVISSPGGLMPEISKEDYLKGSYSFLRNPILANVFHRLDIVEIFATGIRRINESYKNSISKPIFDITEGAISITLPLLNIIQLSLNEQKVFEVLKDNYLYSRADLEKASSLEKATLLRTLNSLIEKNLVIKSGKAQSIVYKKKL